MADARQIARADEIHTQRMTMKAGAGLTYDRTKAKGTALVGAPVKVSAEMTVIPCVADDVPFGAVESIEPDGMCVVAWHGAVKYAGAGTFGSGVVAAGSGKVKAATTGGKGTAVSTIHSGHVIVIQ